MAADTKHGLVHGLRAELTADILDEALIDPTHAVVDPTLELTDHLTDTVREVDALFCVVGRGLVEIGVTRPAALAGVAKLLHARRHHDPAVGVAALHIEVTDAVEELCADRKQPSRQLDLPPLLRDPSLTDPTHALPPQRRPSVADLQGHSQLPITIEVDPQRGLQGHLYRHVGPRDQCLEDRQVEFVDPEIIDPPRVSAKASRQPNQCIAKAASIGREKRARKRSVGVGPPARDRAVGSPVEAGFVELEPRVGRIPAPALGQDRQPGRQHDCLALSVVRAPHIREQFGLVDRGQLCASIDPQVGPWIGQRRPREVIGGLDRAIADEVGPPGVVMTDKARIVNPALLVDRIHVTLRRDVGTHACRRTLALPLLVMLVMLIMLIMSVTRRDLIGRLGGLDRVGRVGHAGREQQGQRSAAPKHVSPSPGRGRCSRRRPPRPRGPSTHRRPTRRRDAE